MSVANSTILLLKSCAIGAVKVVANADGSMTQLKETAASASGSCDCSCKEREAEFPR